MPFSDLSRSRGSQFKPLSKVAFFICVANFLILMELGAKHVESPFIEFGQISTVIYFAHFLIIVPLISLFENSLTELSRESYGYWYLPQYILVQSGFIPSPRLCAPAPTSYNTNSSGGQWNQPEAQPEAQSQAQPQPEAQPQAQPQPQAQSEPQGYGEVVCVLDLRDGTWVLVNPANGVCREYDPVTQEMGPVAVQPGLIAVTPDHIEDKLNYTQAHSENMTRTKIQRDLSYNSDRLNPYENNGGQGENGDSGPSAGPSADPSTGPSTGPSAGPSTGPSASPSADPSPDSSPDSSAPSSPSPISDTGSPGSIWRIALPTDNCDFWPTDDTPSDIPYDIILLTEGLGGLHVSVPSCLFITWYALVLWLRVKLFMHWYNNNKYIIKALPVVWLLGIKSYLYNHKKIITIAFSSLIIILLSIGMFSASLSSLYPHIDTSLFTGSLLHCDAPRPWGIYFQDNATPQMEGLVELHDNILFYLVIILFGVGWLLISTVKSYSNRESPISNKYLSHGTLIELIWTITPALILILIAFPSFKLLYLMDEVNDPSMAVLAEGHQWYWSYQYPDFLNLDDEFIEFDSYLVPESDLEYGALRMLEVDNRLIMPELTHVRFVTTGADVIHSLACPALGIKCDAYPGRLNQTSLMISREGVYYGQCSEICGILHSSMPVVIESVSIGKFVSWLQEQ